MKLKDLLFEYRAVNSLSMEDFAIRCGLTRAYISVLEKGINPRNKKPVVPTLETYDKLATGMNISLEELFSKIEDAPVSLSGKKRFAFKTYASLDLIKPEFKKRIPILGRVSAGLPCYANENIECYEMVENERLDYGLIVKGDSMIGARICEGDVVYMERDADYNNGDIVIALVGDDEATIKRYYQYGDKVILRPENPKYKEIETNADEVKLLGKVVEFKVKL